MQRWYKKAIRILLVLSVVNFMFVGFAQARAIHEGRVQATTNSEIQPVSPEHPPANQPPQSPPEPVNPEPSPERPPANQPPQATQSPPEPANPEPSPDDNKFYSKEMEEKFQAYLILGAVEGIIGAISSDGIQRQIEGTASPGAQSIGRNLIARALGVSQILNDHPQTQEDLVSRSLANLRDGDLRFLGTLSRRLVESLD